jgi:hypothetical protein
MLSSKKILIRDRTAEKPYIISLYKICQLWPPKNKNGKKFMSVVREKQTHNAIGQSVCLHSPKW